MEYISYETDNQIEYIKNNANQGNVKRMKSILYRYTKDIPEDGVDSQIYRVIKEKCKEKNVVERASNSANRMFNSTKKFLPRTPAHYLDIGCGDGSITKEFAQLMKAENYYGIEVMRTNNDMKYIELNDDGTVVCEDNYFDCISAFMSLHHIKKCEVMISEIIRILKPGGVLLIKEHDCRSNLDRMLIDIEHSVFSYIEEDKPLHESKYGEGEYYCKCRNRFEWSEALIPLKFIRGNIMKNRKGFPHPTRAFWAVYVK